MMSDSSRLGVSTDHREPQRTEVLYKRTITVALGKTQWMATQSAAPSQLRRPLPNFSVGGEQATEAQHVPQASKPGRATGQSEHPLADCMLPDPGPWEVMYFSTWTYTDRERGPLGEDSEHTVKRPGQEEEGFKTGHTGAHCHISQDGTQAEDKGESLGLP